MRRALTATLLTAVVLPLAACAGGARTPTEGAAPTSGTPTSSTADPEDRAPSPRDEQARSAPPSPREQVHAVLAGMTRRQQIAQLFLVGVPLDDVGRGEDLAGRGVGGVFLAGRSEIPADDLADVTEGWHRAAGQAGLWVAVDQEGGNVQTLSGPGFGRLPTAEEQARLPAAQFEALAQDLGAALAGAGINLNLAPVADVVPAGTEKTNEPIGFWGRQYGATPAEVAAAAEVVLDGMAEHGVTGVLKHFPGLGRVRGNTDTRAEVVDPATRPDDEQVRLFAELADAAEPTPFVMTSSAVYPAIDDARPAGWSGLVVDQLLRRELGFDGVVVSDDVGAAAAVQDVPPGDRAIRCLRAGGTLVLTIDPDLFPEMLEAVVRQDRTDEEFSTRIDGAVRTALLAKATAGLLTS